MRTQPKKVIRATVQVHKDLGDFDSVAALVKFCVDERIDLKSTVIAQDYSTTYMIYEELESESSFNLRVNEYHRKLALYKQWYDDNIEEILLHVDKMKRKWEEEYLLKLSNLKLMANYD